MRARWMVVLLALALALVGAGCSDGATPLPDAEGAPDLPPPTPDQKVNADGAAGVSFSLGRSTFALCRCHNGAGPGLDGKVPVQLTNNKDQPVVVTPASVDVTPAGGGDPIHAGTDAPTTSTLTVSEKGTSAAELTVAPGESRAFDVVVAVDLDEAQLVEGAYIVSLGLTIAGETLMLPAGTTSISLTP